MSKGFFQHIIGERSRLFCGLEGGVVFLGHSSCYISSIDYSLMLCCSQGVTTTLEVVRYQIAFLS